MEKFSGDKSKNFIQGLVKLTKTRIIILTNSNISKALQYLVAILNKNKDANAICMSIEDIFERIVHEKPKENEINQYFNSFCFNSVLKQTGSTCLKQNNYAIIILVKDGVIFFQYLVLNEPLFYVMNTHYKVYAICGKKAIVKD